MEHSTTDATVQQDLEARCVSQVDLSRRLSGLHPFQGILDKDIQQIVDAAHVLQYPPDAVLFEQGCRSDELHIVLDGSLGLVHRFPGSKPAVLDWAMSGAVVGELGFLTGRPRTFSAIAGPSGSRCLILNRSSFDRLLEESPTTGYLIYRRLFESMQARLDRLPDYWQNFVMWGYHLPQTENPPESPGQWSPRRLLALGGLLAGASFGLMEEDLVSRMVSSPLGLPSRSAGFDLLTFTVFAAGCGWIFGLLFHALQFISRRIPSGRSCARCRFVTRNPSGKPVCVFARENILCAVVRPGSVPAGHTDCPCFERRAPVAAPAEAPEHL